jgi:serine/threonine protein kinase
MECYSDDKKFVIGKMIGQGGFASVYECENFERVVIKLEEIKDVWCEAIGESRVYNLLKDCQYVPKCHGHGHYVEDVYEDALDNVSDESSDSESAPREYTFIALERFDTDLSKLSQSTINIDKLARHLIDGLECIHSKGIVHNDIKPGNILIKKDGCTVFADFGLSSTLHDKCGKRRSERVRSRRIGSPNHMSLDTMSHRHTTLRSDMESLGYVLLNITTGLPWVQKETTRQSMSDRLKTIEKIKLEFKAAVESVAYEKSVTYKIGEGSVTVDLRLINYFKLVYDLDFNETPDYTTLKNCF